MTAICGIIISILLVTFIVLILLTYPYLQILISKEKFTGAYSFSVINKYSDPVEAIAISHTGMKTLGKTMPGSSSYYSGTFGVDHDVLIVRPNNIVLFDSRKAGIPSAFIITKIGTATYIP